MIATIHGCEARERLTTTQLLSAAASVKSRVIDPQRVPGARERSTRVEHAWQSRLTVAAGSRSSGTDPRSSFADFPILPPTTPG